MPERYGLLAILAGGGSIVMMLISEKTSLGVLEGIATVGSLVWAAMAGAYGERFLQAATKELSDDEPPKR